MPGVPQANCRQAEAGFARSVLVVGSGFGGSVAACRLTQAGFGVTLLERGRRYGPNDFPDQPPDSQLAPDVHRWVWNHDQGLWDVQDLGDVVAAQAAGYGGGSLIYANVHLRPPRHVFNERWPEVYRERTALDPYYDLAGYMLDAAPVTEDPKMDAALVKADQLNRSAVALKRSGAFFKPPLAIRYTEGKNVAGRDQKACVGCGACVTGCPHTAKNTLDLNYLALAEKRGLVVHTRCEVLKIDEQPEPNHWHVHCRDHQLEQDMHFCTHTLFLCAGVVHTTRLLGSAQLQRLPGDAPKPVTRRVGTGYYPGSGALAMIYDTRHEQHPSFGPTITTSQVQQRASAGPGRAPRFFMIQDGGYARELERLLGGFRAPIWAGRNRLTRPAAEQSAVHVRHVPWIDSSAVAEANLRQFPARAAAKPTQPSVLESLLDAQASGAFDACVPAELKDAWPLVLQELERPLQMQAIVKRTIELAMEARLGHLPKPLYWLLQRLAWLLVRGLGGTAALGHWALRAAVRGGDVPRGDVARDLLGYDARGATHRTLLLAMGQDSVPGELQVHDGKVRADLDLYELSSDYAEEEQLMSDVAESLDGELRTNPAWAMLGKPITVHNQGGCRMSATPGAGVTDPDGRVYDCAGLYILDGSLMCTSAGVNPSATITAIAERNVLRFIQATQPGWPGAATDAGAKEYRAHVDGARTWAAHAGAKGWHLEPPKPSKAPLFNVPIGLTFKERMSGSFSPIQMMVPPAEADRDHDYFALETYGRGQYPLELRLQLSAENLAEFLEDERNRLGIGGTVWVRLPGEEAAQEYEVVPEKSVMELLVPRQRPAHSHYRSPGRPPNQPSERAAITEALSGKFQDDDALLRARQAVRGDGQRYMNYYVTFTVGATQWMVSGYKRVRNDPGPDLWRSTAALFCALWEIETGAGTAHIRGGGVARLPLQDFTNNLLPSMHVTGTDDPARVLWAQSAFSTYFFGSLQRIYVPGISNVGSTLFRTPHQRIER